MFPSNRDDWPEFLIKCCFYWFVAWVGGIPVAVRYGRFGGANAALLVFLACFGLEWWIRRWRGRL